MKPSSQYQQKFGGDLSTQRGNLRGDIKLYSWDIIPKCPIPPNGNEEVIRPCPALRYCNFTKSSPDKEVKCGVTSQYLRSRSEVIFKNHGHYLSEDQFATIGLDLMPLYRMKCRMQIEELGIQSVITTTDRGVIRANPIYKELRETTKAIQQLRKDIGFIAKKSKRIIPESDDLEMGPTTAQDFSEPGSYYESMADGTFKTEDQLKDAQNQGKHIPENKKEPDTKLNLRK